MRDKDQAGCSKIRKPFLDVWTRENSNRAKPRRPSMSVFSAIFVLKENGTQSHSARFLNWRDHVNSVPDLAASPPCLPRIGDFGLFLYGFALIYSYCLLTNHSFLFSEKFAFCFLLFASCFLVNFCTVFTKTALLSANQIQHIF